MATILFVDDEDAIRRAVGMWLTRKGHTVHQAADVAAARLIVDAQADALDGVFIDVRLGEESGLELFHWLAARSPALAERVAFMTGDLVGPQGLDGGFTGPVFAKPFDLTELDAQVARWGSDRP